jgi:carboxyl-terminal processing protease
MSNSAPDPQAKAGDRERFSLFPFAARLPRTAQDSGSGAKGANRDAQALYHEVWLKVRNTFFDLQRLRGWEKWEHRFDDEMASIEDAIKCANKMLASLKDTYTWLRNPAEVEDSNGTIDDSFVGVGIQTSKRPNGSLITHVIPGSPAEAMGLRRGDLITHINGQSVVDLSEEEVTRRIRGKLGVGIRLGFQRSGDEWAARVVRGKVPDPAVHTQVFDDNIGYLRLDSFNQHTTMRQMRHALLHKLRDCRALIIDLRGNSGGYIHLAINCASLFIRNGLLVTIEERIAGREGHRLKNCFVGKRGLITDTSADASFRQWVRRRQQCIVKPSVPIVILVDSETASAAELFTGAMKDNGRAIVIGTRTYGKGIGQTSYPMSHGTEACVTDLRYYTPSGLWPGDAQRKRNRLKPHITVRSGARFHRSSIRRDKQLQAAFRHLGCSPAFDKNATI